MTNTHHNQKRIRKYYGKIREVAEMPNLIEVQRSSYDIFLNSGDLDVPLDNEGIQGVFNSVFPIKDFNDTAVLEYVSYELEKPKYDVEECQQRDMTYSAPLKVKLRLVVFDIDDVTGSKSVKGIKEQDVYMGDIPLMTPNGTFVLMVLKELLFLKCIDHQGCFLIMIEVNLILQVKFYLPVE